MWITCAFWTTFCSRLATVIILFSRDEDLDDKPKKAKEWNAPKWTQGLIVKPDEKYRNEQVRLWGIITAIGAVFPPAQEYMGRFTWLVCMAQLTFRGMPREETEMGGVGIAFGRGGKGSHRGVAALLSVSIWIVGAIITYGFMPSWAKGRRWTPTLAFAIQNLIFGVSCSYLQPYKG